MKNATTTTVKNTAKNTTHLLFAPERKIIDAESSMKLAARATDYNSNRDARDFKALKFDSIKFKGEDFSCIEAHYASFTDCEFIECKLSRMEAYFAEFENCTFTNCDVKNANFSFAKITDTAFFNSNLDGADFPFASGNFSCTGCMMERSTANNANLHLILSQSNAAGFDANCAKIELDVTGSSLRRAEFNDGVISGKIENSDLTNSEFSRSDLEGLLISTCATCGMDTENSSGRAAGIDKTLEEALNALEEGLDD